MSARNCGSIGDKVGSATVILKRPSGRPSRRIAFSITCVLAVGCCEFWNDASSLPAVSVTRADTTSLLARIEARAWRRCARSPGLIAGPAIWAATSARPS